MIVRDTRKAFIILLLVPLHLLILMAGTACFASHAYLPLQVTNIKPAGTGDPPIPETNRIFRAYPGIEYNIRPAVIGGVYPYTFALQNAPSGMTINPFTGEITWSNPHSDSGTITLKVTDQEHTTVTTSWSITVTTDGFLFVDQSYTGETETGTIDHPFRNMRSLLQHTYRGTHDTDIVYWRAGVYTLLAYDPNSTSAGEDLGFYNWPSIWIAYPGETVTLRGGTGTGELTQLRVSRGPLYFDGLIFKNLVDYGIKVSSSINYKTVRRCTFDGLRLSDRVNNNYGFISTPNEGVGYFCVIQDNKFSDWEDCVAIGPFYNDMKMLIEDNYLHDPYTSGGRPIGIGIKYNCTNTTIRHNKVVMNAGTPMADSFNSLFSNVDNTEVCFNYFDNRNSSSPNLHKWNADGWFADGVQGPLYYHRNTAVGKAFTVYKYENEYWHYAGPMIFEYNVIVSTDNTVRGLTDRVTYSNNLDGSESDNIVDSHGNLTEAYSSYLGTHGWQILRESSQPEAPKNLKVIGAN